MLGARGVALGLGKVNLNDLGGLTAAQQRQAAANQRVMAQKAKESKPRVVVKKHVDRKTLFAACRAVIFGSLLVVMGLAMATIGYYASPLSTTKVNSTKVVDKAQEMQLKSLSYIGPTIMGVGAFILMIACVMTLESRDKHAQIIHEVPADAARRTGSSKSAKSRGSAEEVLPLKPKVQEKNNFEENNNNIADRDVEKGQWPNKSQHLQGQTGEFRIPPDISNRLNATPKDTDSGPQSSTTTTFTLSKSTKESDLAKFPSTSCLEGLLKKADTRALLRRFLEDQSNMADQMQRHGRMKKQSNSLDIGGCERVVLPSRTVKSEEMTVRHSTVAEVHPPPSGEDEEGVSESRSDLPYMTAVSQLFNVQNNAVGRCPPPDERSDLCHLPLDYPDTPMSLSQSDGWSMGSHETVRDGDSSLSSSYVTVHDGSDDNGNNLCNADFHSLSSSLATLKDSHRPIPLHSTKSCNGNSTAHSTASSSSTNRTVSLGNLNTTRRKKKTLVGLRVINTQNSQQV